MTVTADNVIYGWFFGLGSLSIVLSIIVAISIYQIGIRSASTRLVFFLQCTQILEEIWSLPDIYLHPVRLCQASTALKEYFTMANLLANFFMSYYSYTMIFNTSDGKYQVSRLTHIVLFTLPIITFLPLITDGYGAYETYWCSYLRTGRGDQWFSAFLAIEFAIVCGSIFCVAVIILRLVNVGDGNYGAVMKVGRSSGLYSLATICCWFPKVFTLNDHNFHSSSPDAAIFAARLFSYVVGLVYCAIFLFERTSLMTFELYVKEQVESNMDFNDSFSTTSSEKISSQASVNMYRGSMVSDVPRNVRVQSNVSVISPVFGISRTASTTSSVVSHAPSTDKPRVGSSTLDNHSHL
jgi:hypothetical protein